MNKIDARGLSCPEPVILTKKVLQENGSPLTVLVDNQVAVQNILRYAANHNLQASYTVDGNDFVILLS